VGPDLQFAYEGGNAAVIDTRSFPHMAVCDVCRILDFSTEEKMCVWCNLCGSNICLEDQNKWGRRIKAALKKKLEPGYSGMPDYEKHAVSREQLEQILKEKV
jgi:hypothetical protein